MEAFFVVVTACVVLGVAVWALVAVRHLLTLTEPGSREPAQTPSSKRRPGD